LDVQRKNQLTIDLSCDGISFQFASVHTASPRTFTTGWPTLVFKIDHRKAYDGRE
jgi:hypothetical protein